MKADLHCHSNFSDGRLSPEELVREAARCGVTLLSLTDHDTTAGLAQAHEACRQDLVLMDGIEISAVSDGVRVDLLGYGSGVLSPEMTKMTAHYRSLKPKRIRKILQKLAVLGLPVAWDELEADSYDNLGRPHIARAMVKKGYTQSTAEAFAHFLAAGEPAYVPREMAAVDATIRIMRALDVVPVVAHPAQIALPQDRVFKAFDAWREAGLLGIECYHPSNDVVSAQRYDRYARDHGLLVTGGSDFHESDPTDPKHGELGSQCTRWIRQAEDVDRLMRAVNLQNR